MLHIDYRYYSKKNKFRRFDSQHWFSSFGRYFFALIEYPAIADFELTQSLRNAAKELQIPVASSWYWNFFLYILGWTREIRWLFWICAANSKAH